MTSKTREAPEAQGFKGPESHTHSTPGAIGRVLTAALAGDRWPDVADMPGRGEVTEQ